MTSPLQAAMSEPKDDELWTVKDVARFLKVSPRTVYDIPGLPKIPLRGRGRRLMRRYDPETVKAWARAQSPKRKSA